jgi:3-dehydroquinate synthase
MASRVLLKKGFLRKLTDLAKLSIPAVSFGTKNYLVTDEIVNGIYGTRVLRALRCAGLDVQILVIPSTGLDETGDASTERSKTTEVFHRLADDILERGITKNSCIISLGGGVVNNICGFLAGSLYRGIHLVHIATTMMAMVDAAIDFKQAVNHCRGKNLLGCYYPAEVIIIDPEVLLTQSVRAIRNGLAESLKHGVCHSVELVNKIVEGAGKIKDTQWLTEVIQQTIALKAPTLTNYENSDFNEMCPQYGHAVGHSVEFLSFKCDRALLHGEGVSIGSCVSADIAYLMGVCSEETVDELYRVHEAAGLPVYVPEGLSIVKVTQQMLYDKHFHGKRVTMGLLKAVGEMQVLPGGIYSHNIDPSILTEALGRNYSRRSKTNIAPVSEEKTTCEELAGTKIPATYLATLYSWLPGRSELSSQE